MARVRGRAVSCFTIATSISAKAFVAGDALSQTSYRSSGALDRYGRCWPKAVICDCLQIAGATDGLMQDDYRRLTITNGRSSSWSALPSSETVTRLDSVTRLKIGVSDRCNLNKTQ